MGFPFLLCSVPSQGQRDRTRLCYTPRKTIHNQPLLPKKKQNFYTERLFQAIRLFFLKQNSVDMNIINILLMECGFFSSILPLILSTLHTDVRAASSPSQGQNLISRQKSVRGWKIRLAPLSAQSLKCLIPQTCRQIGISSFHSMICESLLRQLTTSVGTAPIPACSNAPPATSTSLYYLKALLLSTIS